MNNITETSLFAYDTIKPHLSKRQQQVYDIISKHTTLHAKGIAVALGLKINQVTGRINELLYDKQSIKIVKVVDNQSYYGIRTESDPLNKRLLTPEQKLQKFRSWIKTKQYVTSDEALKVLDKIDEYIV